MNSDTGRQGTGSWSSKLLRDPSPRLVDFASKFEHTDEEVRSRIDQMEVSADTKALLHSFSKATLTAGKAIIKVGRKIIDVLFSILRQFPHLTFGVVFGLVVGALVSAIPLIGTVLASIATPLAVLFGVVIAFPYELQAGDLGERISAVVSEFAPLAA